MRFLKTTDLHVIHCMGWKKLSNLVREDGETCFGVGVAVRVVHQLETFYASVPLALADFYISEGYYLQIYYWRGIIQIIQ